MKALVLRHEPLFTLGQVLHTAGAGAAYTSEEMSEALSLHAMGEWGCVGAATRRENDQAAVRGGRVRSAYKFEGREDLWIVTEYEGEDRHTTLLMASED